MRYTAAAPHKHFTDTLIHCTVTVTATLSDNDSVSVPLTASVSSWCRHQCLCNSVSTSASHRRHSRCQCISVSPIASVDPTQYCQVHHCVTVCGHVRGPAFWFVAVLADQRDGRCAEPGRVRACDEEAEAEGHALEGAQAHRLPGGHVQQPAGGFQV